MDDQSLEELVEHYKIHPKKLFNLGDAAMEQFLRQYFHLTPEDPVVFKFPQSTSPCLLDDRSRANLRDRIHEKAPNNNLTALLWMFYEITTMLFGGLYRIEHERNFHDVFRFGCLKGHPGALSSVRNINYRSWILGIVDKESIYIALDASETNYLTVVEACKNAILIHHILNGILNFLKFRLRNTIPTKVEECRGTVILETLSQNPCLPDEHGVLEFKYPYLANLNWLNVRDPEFMIPRVRWSRQKHRNLTSPQLRDQTFTILCMQKHRSVEFPLHKDLIDTLIRILFDLELQELERKALIKTQMAQKWNCHKPVFNVDENIDRCLDIGVSQMSYGPWESYVLDLACGFPVPEHIQHQFRRQLAHEIVGWPSCNWIYSRLCKRFPNLEDLPFVGGSLMLDYFKTAGYPLKDLYRDKIVLQESDLGGIMDAALDLL